MLSLVPLGVHSPPPVVPSQQKQRKGWERGGWGLVSVKSNEGTMGGWLLSVIKKQCWHGPGIDHSRVIPTLPNHHYSTPSRQERLGDPRKELPSRFKSLSMM